MAGRGVTHSERLERARAEGGRLHGIQAWVALPEAERAAYVVGGSVEAGGTAYHAGQLLVFGRQGTQTLRAQTASTVMLIGGRPVGPRIMKWNFVSSSRGRAGQGGLASRSDEAAGPRSRRVRPLPEPTPPSRPGETR